MTNAWTTLPSPVGELTVVATDRGLRAVLWPDDEPSRVPLDLAERPDPSKGCLADAVRQLEAYFAGRLQEFDLPLDLVGTSFQVAVWRALGDIPYGETVTYGGLAASIGQPGKARAVGTAVGRNPVSVVLPCHRVVGASGALTGFAGGLDAKRLLLDLEQGATRLPLSSS